MTAADLIRAGPAGSVPPLAAPRARRAELARDGGRRWLDEPSLGLLALWAEPRTSTRCSSMRAHATCCRFRRWWKTGGYPALSPNRPGAAWFERMIRDLWGHEAEGARDLRPWLDHGRWGGLHPLALRPLPAARQPGAARVPSRGGRGSASDPDRPDPCRQRSSRAISASPRTARRWCGWRCGSATRTRASSR